MAIAILPLFFGLMTSTSPVTSAAQTKPAQLVVVNAVSEQDIAQKTRKVWNLTTDLLGGEDRIRFVFPVAPRRTDDQEPADSFRMTFPILYAGSDLFRLIRDVELPRPEDPLRIADAVKFAGYAATAGQRPRAVLLVLSGNERDQSLDNPVTVRHLLSVLRVPLYVWSLGDSKPGSTVAAWGAEDISQTWNLAASVGRIRKELDAQRTLKADGGLLQGSPVPSRTGR